MFQKKIFYYEVAPIIVKNIEQRRDCELFYQYIYENVIDICIKAIEKGDYIFAYNIYRSNVLFLADFFVSSEKEREKSLAKKLKSNSKKTFDN